MSAPYEDLRSNTIHDEASVLKDKFKYPFKVDRRKRRHRAPGNHPWRQYKLTNTEAQKN